MKKVWLFLILFFPCIIYASEINSIFIDSEVDIAGCINIKEIVDINSPVSIAIDYSNEIGKKYLSSGVKINSIGILKENYDISHFYDEDFKNNNVLDSEKYTYVDNNNKLIVNFYEKGTYYIDYIVLNVGIKYKYSSEFYYKYMSNFNYDVNNVNIVTRLQDKSDKFYVRVKSNAMAKVIKDNTNNIINIKIDNYKKNEYVTVRILYDEYLSSANISKVYKYDGNLFVYFDDLSLFNKSFIITSIILILLIIISIIYSNNKINIERINIKDKKIDKNIKILLISDLHNRDIYLKMKKILNKNKFDICIFAGDMMDCYGKNNDNFYKLCELFNKKNVYYTYGNHEIRINDIDVLKLKNIKIFNDKKTELSKNINLYSINPKLEYYEKLDSYHFDNKYLLNNVGKIDKEKYNILICHNPFFIDTISSYGFDMTLSGHVHGGIVKLPIIGGIFSPEFKLFPKYYSGLYKIKNCNLIVSRGLGFSKKLPFRINNTCHVIMINIMKK